MAEIEARVTSMGRVTLPKATRRRLGIEPGDLVRVSVTALEVSPRTDDGTDDETESDTDSETPTPPADD